MSGELANRQTIAELVVLYQESVAEVRAHYAALDAIEERLNATFLGRSADCPAAWQRDFKIVEWRYHRNVDDMLEALKRCAWGRVVERLGLQRMLSPSRWDELTTQLEKDDLPEISVATINTFAAQYLNSLDQILAESVAEIYDWLRPRDVRYGGGTYKTNQKNIRGLTDKVIVQSAVEKGWNGGWRLRDWNGKERARFIALDNVFSALDGRGAIAKTHNSPLVDAITASDGVGETAYFRFRCYANHNLHLQFRRLDLLKRFNQIAGGKRLNTSEAA